jgi:hypothetical protein
METSKSCSKAIIPNCGGQPLQTVAPGWLIQPLWHHVLPCFTVSALTLNMALSSPRQSNEPCMVFHHLQLTHIIVLLGGHKPPTVWRSHRGEGPVMCLCCLTAVLEVVAWTIFRFPSKSVQSESSFCVFQAGIRRVAAVSLGNLELNTC